MPKRSDPVAPHNLEAERSVLGGILLHNDSYQRAAQLVGPQDFFRDAHRKIFLAIGNLLDRRVAVELVTLKDELTRQGSLEAIGGPAYLSALVDGMPRAVNMPHYAGIVREKATLRALAAVGQTTIDAVYHGKEDSQAILESSDRAILDLRNWRVSDRLLRLGSAEVFAALEQRVEHKHELSGVDTGFVELNRITQGWQRADLNIIAARPSIGKTTFGVNTATAAARAGMKVVMFSLEMRRYQLERRLLASLSGVSLRRILSGYLIDSDYPKLAAAIQVMDDLPIWIDDGATHTAIEIRRSCRRLRAEQGLDLVVIDYVQLMPGTLDRRGANRNEEITDISRRLKALADELGVPVLLMSQLTRASQGRGADTQPRLSDLRESGALEQDADVVIMLHRKNHREGGLTSCILEKQRNGPTGTIELYFEREITTFRAYELADRPEPKSEPAGATQAQIPPF